MLLLVTVFTWTSWAQVAPVVVPTGKSSACRVLTTSSQCIASSNGCWFCGGSTGDCFSSGELNCTLLKQFYDNVTMCPNFSCNQNAASPAPRYQYELDRENVSDFNLFGLSGQ